MERPKKFKDFQQENASTRDICTYFLESATLHTLEFDEIDLLHELAQQNPSYDNGLHFLLKDIFTRLGRMTYAKWQSLKKLPIKKATD